MTCLINRQPRKQLRLTEYNYATEGCYYITICTHNRECLFGTVENNVMSLNASGQMIEQQFYAIPQHYPGWLLDSLIVMPNHVHAVLALFNEGPARGPAPTASLPELMRNVKSYTTNCYSHGIRNYNWPAFNKKLWQRNYYEHIIRNQDILDKIRQYILTNPENWVLDKENITNMSTC